jgi:arsenate reductase
MEVQIFGVRKSAETRAALRFFSERRIRTHFVDLDEKEPSPRELERFARKFGVAALIDRQSKRFAELGLGTSQLSDARWLERLTIEPRLLRLPLVRCDNEVTVGAVPEVWRAWCAR